MNWKEYHEGKEKYFLYLVGGTLKRETRDMIRNFSPWLITFSLKIIFFLGSSPNYFLTIVQKSHTHQSITRTSSIYFPFSAFFSLLFNQVQCQNQSVSSQTSHFISSLLNLTYHGFSTWILQLKVSSFTLFHL